MIPDREGETPADLLNVELALLAIGLASVEDVIAATGLSKEGALRALVTLERGRRAAVDGNRKNWSLVWSWRSRKPKGLPAAAAE